MGNRTGYNTNLLLAIVLCATASSAAQSPSVSSVGNAFPPVERWKTAIVDHDMSALRAFYSKAPAAKIGTSKGDIDIDAEIKFWMDLKPSAMKIDIEKSETPQPDIEQIIAQIELRTSAVAGAQKVYVSDGQIWRQQNGAWQIVASKRSDAARLEQPLSVDKNIYSPGTDAHAEITEALSKASKEGKRVIIVFGANWCYDCHVLDTAFHRPEFAAMLARNYQVVHVDVGEGDKNQDLMLKYKVPMKKGIPGLAVLDGNGQLLYSQENGEFEKARSLGPQDLMAFLEKWKPPIR